MKAIVWVVTFSFLCMYRSASADDGAFDVSGNTIRPTTDVDIEMISEVLDIVYIENNSFDIAVHFEFFNPGSDTTVSVGFVVPAYFLDHEPGFDGDWSGDPHPSIDSMSIVMNGAPKECIVELLRERDESGLLCHKLVYLFDALFHSGLNTISHEYVVGRLEDGNVGLTLDYILRTGCGWGNRQIDKFTLNIDMGARRMFNVPASFQEDGRAAPWVIDGQGSLRARDQNNTLWVFIREGRLTLQLDEFCPEGDLSIGMLWREYEVKYWRPDSGNHAFSDYLWKYVGAVPYHDDPHVYLDMNYKELSSEDIRLVRNFFYALRGYEFGDDKLGDVYSQYFWYHPNPGLDPGDIVFEPWEEEIIMKTAASSTE